MGIRVLVLQLIPCNLLKNKEFLNGHLCPGLLTIFVFLNYTIPMKMNGSRILLESLRKEGINTIFGYPGGVVLPLYDALFDFDIRHILTRHEQGAVHAADGYSRSTGKVGVCLVTSGPGATNTVTGIATAYMDSIPLVVLTGQVPTALIGNDAFQEADIVGITRPCTKYSYLVKDVNDIAKTVKEAFYIASTGSPGPVLIDLPKDVLISEARFSYPESVHLRSYKPVYKGHIQQIKKVARTMLDSQRPVLYVGGGTISSNASDELRRLAHLTQAPVTTTLMGMGAFPSDDPLSLGMCGMHGTFQANMAMQECDLLISLGARFDDRVTGNVSKFSPKSVKVHVNIDPTAIGKSIAIDLPVVGDVKHVLKDLIDLLSGEKRAWKKDLKPWRDQIESWRETFPLKYRQGEGAIKPQYVVEKISEMTKGEAIIATDVGQHQMWSAQYLKFKKPRSFLTSGGLGTMGFGFPAALGAQAAFPGKTVVAITGDGGFQMNSQELITAVQYNLPVKIAIINNHFLGMVRQWQQLFFDKRYSYSCLASAPDFVKLAEAHGLLGLRAKRKADVEKVLETAFKTPKPVLMDFRVIPEENVYPMVPAGAALSEMLLA